MNRFTAASSFSVIRAFRRHWLREVTAALLVAGLLLQSVQAVAPEWWTARGVFKAGASADDYAAANVGQLKHLAQKAAAQMNDVLPGGAGAAIDGLIAAWSAAPAAGVTRDDYAAVSVGQLKRVAKPFYDRLGLAYPWGSGLATDDFAVANVGQLKRVFSFAVPDAATLGLTDSDGDGFSDVLEFTEGTNPYLASDKPAGGGDVPPGGGGGSGGAEAGWTPAQLAAAEAAYDVGLQARSVGIYAYNEVFGDYSPWDPGASWEIQYRSYLDIDIFQEAPVWEYDYSSWMGFDEEKLEEGLQVLNDEVGGASLPNWDSPAGASLWMYGVIMETRADQSFGVYGSKAELRLVRQLKEGQTDPVDGNNNPIKPEVRRSFLKVTTIPPNGSQAPPAEVIELVIPEGADVSTTTTGVLYPELDELGAHRVDILPVDFEIIHIEKERDENGDELPTAVSPGKNVLLRDEIANLRINVPTTGGSDWHMRIDLEPTSMKTAILGARGIVQMYDFATVDNGIVTPLSANADGTTKAGPYNLTLEDTAWGVKTIRIVVNKEGKFRLRLRSADDQIDLTSQEFTVLKRIRKYARRPENNDADFDKHDQSFVEAAEAWGQFYQNSLDPDILKAMGMQESTLGYGATPTVDILTINFGGYDGDNVLAILRKEHAKNEKEAVPGATEGGWTVRWLDYDDAQAGSAKTAIYWGTCWLFHKAQKGRFVPADNPPHYVKLSGWNTWEQAVGYYGPNPVYLGVIEGPWKRGRRDSTTGRDGKGVWKKMDFPAGEFQYLWPILSNQRPRK